MQTAPMVGIVTYKQPKAAAPYNRPAILNYYLMLEGQKIEDFATKINDMARAAKTNYPEPNYIVEAFLGEMTHEIAPPKVTKADLRPLHEAKVAKK